MGWNVTNYGPIHGHGLGTTQRYSRHHAEAPKEDGSKIVDLAAERAKRQEKPLWPGGIDDLEL